MRVSDVVKGMGYCQGIECKYSLILCCVIV